MISIKRSRLAFIIVLLATSGISTPAMAELSANVGFASEYYYRGVLQKQSSANAGVYFERDGFYAGTLVADVDDGLKVDLYGGHNWELEGGYSVSLGVAGNHSTGDIDDTYREFNVSAAWGPIRLGYSKGTYKEKMLEKCG
jgi:uncharacterized protein (TIGR02001 family)